MTRRSEIERLLREVREQAQGRDGDRRELKAYVGVDFDGFPLPEDARERVEQAIQSGHPARIVAVETSDDFDMEDSHHVIGASRDLLTGEQDDDT